MEFLPSLDVTTEFIVKSLFIFLPEKIWEIFTMDRSIPSYGLTLALSFACWVIPFQFIREDGPAQLWLGIKMRLDPDMDETKGTIKQLLTCMICQPPYWATFFVFLHNLPFTWIFVLWGYVLAIHFILDRINPSWANLEPDRIQ